MDENKLEEELKKMWEETPVSHSDSEKETSWEQFQAKTFPSKERKLKPWMYYAAAAAILIFGFIGTRVFNTDNPLQVDNFVASTVIENPTSKVKSVFLPDSSVVELSPNSKIKYVSNFVANRKIEVEGSAYFKVKKDKKHPFQVFCKETTTTVLGTSFSVNGSTDKEVVVELFEGSVQMNVKDQKENWILKPGEKFTYSNKIVAVTDFNRFVDFENEKLVVLSTYIETNYGYKMILPKEFDTQRITLRINKKENLKTIIQLISEMYNLNFEVNEEIKQITFQ
ncbi:FecR family protein [Flavobacterium sp. ABG]|uniref:FecR family protein n=1 Tax=Flavobacterium sp. ABG TaxID=1423322 RepID=UPI00064AD2DC|nr:FecR family protein [Flavobacterium sp. ABG]KLT68177.1 iron dicitrate transport regulator FecR [Flavobacterium sp. ABG]